MSSPRTAGGSACADCTRALRHCHATWVRHADGTGECTETEGCDVPPENHDVLLDCDEVDPRCCR